MTQDSQDRAARCPASYTAIVDEQTLKRATTQGIPKGEMVDETQIRDSFSVEFNSMIVTVSLAASLVTWWGLGSEYGPEATEKSIGGRERPELR